MSPAARRRSSQLGRAWLTRPATVMLCLALGVVAGVAMARPGFSGLDSGTLDELHRAGERPAPNHGTDSRHDAGHNAHLRSSSEAARIARDREGGRVLNVILEQGRDGPYYLVKILEQGRVRVVHVDARR